MKINHKRNLLTDDVFNDAYSDVSDYSVRVGTIYFSNIESDDECKFMNLFKRKHIHSIKFTEIYVSAMRSKSEYSLFREANAGWDGSMESQKIGDSMDDYERKGKYEISIFLCKPDY